MLEVLLDFSRYNGSGRGNTVETRLNNWQCAD